MPPSLDALAQPVMYWLVTRFMCSCSAACVTCRKCSIIGLMIEVRSASWMPSHFGKAPDVSRGVVDDILRQQRQAHNRDRGPREGLGRDLVASRLISPQRNILYRGAQYQQALAALLVPLLQFVLALPFSEFADDYFASILKD